MAEFKLKQTAEEVQKAIDDASIPSDWNQTDSSAADFIKNKTHYYSEKIFSDEPAVEVHNGMFTLETNGTPGIGTFINFVLNGTNYLLEVVDYGGMPMFGNFSIMGAGDNTGEPFVGGWQAGTSCMVILEEGTYTQSTCTVKISGREVVKIPESFYNKHTVFFTNMGLWIYKDSSFTQKATAQDLMKAINNGPVMINAQGQVFYQPSEFWMIPAYEENGIQYSCLCCKIATNFDENGATDYAVIHTAEYTAS